MSAPPAISVNIIYTCFLLSNISVIQPDFSQKRGRHSAWHKDCYAVPIRPNSVLTGSEPYEACLLALPGAKSGFLDAVPELLKRAGLYWCQVDQGNPVQQKHQLAQ